MKRMVSEGCRIYSSPPSSSQSVSLIKIRIPGRLPIGMLRIETEKVHGIFLHEELGSLLEFIALKMVQKVLDSGWFLKFSIWDTNGYPSWFSNKSSSPPLKSECLQMHNRAFIPKFYHNLDIASHFRILVHAILIKRMFQPGFEPGTVCVLDRRDNQLHH